MGYMVLILEHVVAVSLCTTIKIVKQSYLFFVYSVFVHDSLGGRVAVIMALTNNGPHNYVSAMLIGALVICSVEMWAGVLMCAAPNRISSIAYSGLQ